MFCSVARTDSVSARSELDLLWESATTRRKRGSSSGSTMIVDLRSALAGMGPLSNQSGYDLMKVLDIAQRLPSEADRVKYVSLVLDELRSGRRKGMISKQSIEYPKRILLAIERVFPGCTIEGRETIRELRVAVISRLSRECNKPSNTELYIELYVRSPGFREKHPFQVPRLDSISDYHLTLIPVITRLVGPHPIYEQALQALVDREAYSFLIKFYYNSSTDDERAVFIHQLRVSLTESNQRSVCARLLNVLHQTDLPRPELRSIALDLIKKYSDKDWTDFLLAESLGVGDLMELKSMMNRECNIWNWLDWVSRVDGVDEVEWVVARGMSGISPNTHTALEIINRIHKQSPNIGELLVRVSPPKDVEDAKLCMHPLMRLAEILPVETDGFRNIVSTSLAVMELVMGTWDSTSANIRADTVSLIGLLIQKIPYTDTARMDVFHYLSLVSGIHSSSVAFIRRRDLSDALLAGIKDSKTRELLSRRIQLV